MNKEKNVDTILSRVQKSLEKILFNVPVLGYVTSNWQKVIVTDEVPTFGTTKSELYVNPYYTEKLTDEEITGVLLHEIFHLIFLHPYDQTYYNEKLMVIARENVVNENTVNLIEKLKINAKLPGEPKKIDDFMNGAVGYVLDRDYFGMDSIEIYEKLKNKYKSKTGTGSCTNNKSCSSNSLPNSGQSKTLTIDDVIPSSSENNITPEDRQMEESISVIVLSELKKKGLISGSAERFLERIMKPSVNWKRQLIRYMKKVVSEDHRKYDGRQRYSTSTILPRFKELNRKPDIQIVVGVDTSGSITEEELNRFFSEIYDIVTSVTDTVRLITVDAKVHEDILLHKKNIHKIKVTGGGGTDFIPFFQYVEENHKPDLIILMTDGYGDYPTKLKYQTIFALTTDYEPPKLKKSTVIRLK